MLSFYYSVEDVIVGREIDRVIISIVFNLEKYSLSRLITVYIIFFLML